MLVSMSSGLRVIFTIFAAFWVVAIVGLYFGVGALLKRQDRILEEQKRRAGTRH